MDDDKLAPEGGDAEGAKADPESQPSPDAEDATQQQQPDPLADIPYETVRERYADRFEEEAGQREQTGFGRGQGEARKEVAAIRKQLKGEEADRITYERLERMKASDDPEGKETYWHERDDADTDAAYKRGKKAATQPHPEVMEQMRTETADAFLTALNAHLDEHKGLQNLSTEETAGLAKEKHPSLGALVDAKINLITQRGIAGGTTKENAQKLQDAKEEARKELLDDLGIDQPEGLEGHAPAQLPTKKELSKMSTEEIAELERKGTLDKILAGNK